MPALRGGEVHGAEMPYLAKVTASYLGQIPNEKKTDYVEIHFAHADDPAWTARGRFFLTEAAWKNGDGVTARTLRACGWNAEEQDYAFEQLNGGAESPLVGDAVVEIVVAERADDSGKLWPEVKWVNEPGGQGPKERLTPEAAKSNADRIRKLIGGKAAKQKPAKPEKAPKRGGPTGPAPVGRKQRVQQAVADHAAKHGGGPPPPANDEGYDFDDIPF
mgnify:CR=1 FL=1